MIERNRISFEALQKGYDSLPVEPLLNEVQKSFARGSGVARALLGKDWTERYIISDSHKKGFFSIDESDPNLFQKSGFRVIDLGEVLYNLQNTPGFDECIEQMRNGNLEDTLAELDLGRMLYIHSVPFRYVIPQGKQGSDYDVEVIYPDGVIACADAKCKIESGEFSAESVKNTLKKGKKQLPENMPGILFVKLPQHWMERTDFAGVMRQVAKDFLRQTTRIVSVKYYVSTLDFNGKYMRHRHAYDEINNPANKFDPNRDWRIFPKIDVPPEWNGMPPHWQRILFFPDGKMR